jgi:hypothetical protein
MRPCSAVDDQQNIECCNSVLVSQCLLGNATTDVSGAYFSYLNFGKFVEIATFTRRHFRILLRYMSSFLEHILGIVLARSKKQVLGVDTSRMVASVKNFHSWRDRAKVKFLRHPMGADSNASGTLSMSVTIGRSCAGPVPASVSLLDVTPKPLLYWEALREIAALARTILGALVSVLWYGKRLAALLASLDGHFIPPKVDPRRLADSCLGNQHIRLWGSQMEKPTGAMGSLDAYEYSTSRPRKQVR